MHPTNVRCFASRASYSLQLHRTLSRSLKTQHSEQAITPRAALVVLTQSEGTSAVVRLYARRVCVQAFVAEKPLLRLGLQVSRTYTELLYREGQKRFSRGKGFAKRASVVEHNTATPPRTTHTTLRANRLRYSCVSILQNVRTV